MSCFKLFCVGSQSAILSLCGRGDLREDVVQISGADGEPKHRRLLVGLCELIQHTEALFEVSLFVKRLGKIDFHTDGDAATCFFEPLFLVSLGVLCVKVGFFECLYPLTFLYTLEERLFNRLWAFLLV